MKNILVTGGSGFIGSNLVRRLFADLKGATIVNIDNMNALAISGQKKMVFPQPK